MKDTTMSHRSASSHLGVCYVADANFLFPTLLSATSLRRFLPVGTARVFIVVFLDAAIDLEAVKERTHQLGLEFIGVTPGSLPVHSGFDWSNTHITPATLGRFLLADLLPPEIDRILYLDGDTMVVGSLDPLLELAVPEGSLAAAEDAAALYRADRSANGRSTRSYLAGIGVPDGRGYFNAGVLLVGRRTWGDMAARALSHLVSYPHLCTFHDQSALNATVGSARLSLSPIWNFQTRYRTWGAPKSLVPHILHFSGAEKPWLGNLTPWQDVVPTLAKDAQSLLPLSLPMRQISQEKIDRHNAKYSGWKERLRTLLDLRRRRRGLAVADLHRGSVL